MQSGAGVGVVLTELKMARLPRDEIVDAILRELGHPRGQGLVLSQNDTRAAVTALVGRLNVALRKGRRDLRKAAADVAKDIDGLLANLELKLTHPLAPLSDPGLISRIERLREVCKKQMLVRPKPGRPSPKDELKRGCAAGAYHLVRRLSRRRIVSSPGGAFLRITELLYEALTGEREANCTRACMWMLDTARPKKQ
jgi:hypothetical protein